MDHLRANGFRVKPVQNKDHGAMRRRHGIPDALGGCHTGIVGDYAIEGHVPAREIRRLLAEKPAAAGLAVPGMPVGSPGMEQGARRDRYEVLLVHRDRPPSVYARYDAVHDPKTNRRTP